MTKDMKRITYLEKQIGKFKSISIRRKVIIERLEARVEELEDRIKSVKDYCVCYKEAPTMIQDALDAVLRRLSDDK